MTELQQPFDLWNIGKKRLNDRNNPPSFQERQVWWCSLGMNIGYEVYGKGQMFTRPVVVVRKFSKSLFWGIPLTSKIEERPHHHPILLKGKQGYAKISQLRLLDSKRLMNMIGYLPENQFAGVIQAIYDTLPEMKKPPDEEA